MVAPFPPAAPVGAQVHYVSARSGAPCRAATVTEVHGDPEAGVRNLRISHASELADRIQVEFGPHREPQTWHAFDPGGNPGCRLARGYQPTSG